MCCALRGGGGSAVGGAAGPGPGPGLPLTVDVDRTAADADPRWDRFLTDTFGDDDQGAEMIRFLHLLLGYSLTGDVGAQVMPFLFGSGKNGKSVLLDVLIKLLGDYADAAPPGFLMARPFEGHPTDLAELHGRRVIVCSEVKPGDRFDEARVKLLTGGDRIKARRMRQDFFSFAPTHKLWLLGNHRPEVGTGGYAFWRRMRLIPSNASSPTTAKSTTSPTSSSPKKDPASSTGSSPEPTTTSTAPATSPDPKPSASPPPPTPKPKTTPADSSTNAAPTNPTTASNKPTSTTPTKPGVRMKAFPLSPPGRSPLGCESWQGSRRRRR